MGWTIDPTVQINGTDYTSDVLNGVNINYGRSTIWEQPRASYATIQIKNFTNSPFNALLNELVTIKVDDYAGTPVTVFTGRVSSISNSIQALGAKGKVTIHTVTAIGPMAQMSRIITHTTSWPKEYDDDRLTRILTASGVGLDVIDTPGVYEFTIAPAAPTDCYTAAAYYAQMAFGYVYETTAGTVGYANESRRTFEAATNGYFIIPDDVIIGNSIQSQLNTNNLVNDVLLEYKANAVVTSTSTTSVTTYGRRASDIITELEDSIEAQNQADRYVALRSTPETILQNFTVQLSAPTITQSVLDALIEVYVGKPIEVTAFPSGIYDGIFRGFVEGWTMTLSQNSASLSLNVTKNTLSLTPTRWQDVDPALQWQNVDPALEWADYV